MSLLDWFRSDDGDDESCDVHKWSGWEKRSYLNPFAGETDSYSENGEPKPRLVVTEFERRECLNCSETEDRNLNTVAYYLEISHKEQLK